MIDFILFDENDVGCIFFVMVIFHESYFENIHGQTGASKQQAMLKDEKWLWFLYSDIQHNPRGHRQTKIHKFIRMQEET